MEPLLPNKSRSVAPVDDRRVLNGGFTTKVHLITNAHGLPIKAEISPGQCSDYTVYSLLQDEDLPGPKVFIADKVCDANAIREDVEGKGGYCHYSWMIKSQETALSRPFCLCIAQPDRAMLQQTQECQTTGNPI